MKDKLIFEEKKQPNKNFNILKFEHIFFMIKLKKNYLNSEFLNLVSTEFSWQISTEAHSVIVIKYMLI